MRRKRLLLLALALLIVLAGSLAWLLYARWHQERLDKALIAAVEKGDRAAVQFLLDSGADVNSRNENSQTALMLAITHPSAECARLLLDRGAAIETTDSGEWTALMWAAFYRSTESARLLVKRGANVNAAGDGGTVLSVAKVRQSPAIVQLLKQAGAKE